MNDGLGPGFGDPGPTREEIQDQRKKGRDPRKTQHKNKKDFNSVSLNSTTDSIEKLFQQIVTRLPNYEYRPQQVEMAKQVAEALETKQNALIEAGTGSGKSFAYLIPLIACEERAVIATGTIALQEQLLFKDIPFLQSAMDKPIKVALAKGRSNYVCLQKLHEAARRSPHGNQSQRMQLRYILTKERKGDWDGDRSSLPMSVDTSLWMSIASNGLECFGPRCEYFGDCPLREARKQLEKADIIIANHALYLTDLSSGAGILPNHSFVVFDEAHHLDQAAISAFSVILGRHAVRILLEKIAKNTKDIPDKLVEDLTLAENSLETWITDHPKSQFKVEPNDEQFKNLIGTLSIQVAKLKEWMDKVDPATMNLFADTQELAKAKAEIARDQLIQQLQRLLETLDYLADAKTEGQRVNWIERNPETEYYEIISAPLDPDKMLAQKLWSQRTSILTSATLTANGGFGYIRHQLGITDCIEKVYDSPFDFQNQATLLLPEGLPNPNDPDYNEMAAPIIAEILRQTKGRAFVLFTSYRSMRQIYQLVGSKITYEFKIQGEMPRSMLIDWFKRTSNSVLFATASFWEGVDIPGENLSCVIIDRLPFTPPDDPVHQARVNKLKAENKDWFATFALPKAIITLKQGFGRLIRTKTDHGVVAILDPRLTTKRYGKTILRALPPARQIKQVEDVNL